MDSLAKRGARRFQGGPGGAARAAAPDGRLEPFPTIKAQLGAALFGSREFSSRNPLTTWRDWNGPPERGFLNAEDRDIPNR